MTWRRPGPFLAYPNDRAHAIVASGAHDALGLDILAWSESSRFYLDGRLVPVRLQRLRGWTQARQAALVAGGFWRLADEGVELVGYLDFNPGRAHFEAVREARAEGGKARAATGQRDADGRLTSRQRVVNASSNGTHHAQPSSTLLVHVPVHVDVEVPTGTSWDGWDPKWQPVRAALEARGLRLPPTIRQREMLWPAVDARASDVAAWVVAAPARTDAAGVFGYVMDRWRAIRDGVA